MTKKLRPPRQVRLVRRGRVLVAEPLEASSPLSREEVRRALDSLREARARRILALRGTDLWHGDLAAMRADGTDRPR